MGGLVECYRMSPNATLRQQSSEDPRLAGRVRLYTWLLWSLTLLFALRVLGQAVQRWAPQAYLPPFAAFQGSALPYWLLLSAQLLILTVMLWTCRRVQKVELVPRRRTGVALAWAGAAYMMVAWGRLLLGLTLIDVPAWFHAWIPAIWHVVLAGFVVTVAAYHCRESARQTCEARDGAR